MSEPSEEAKQRWLKHQKRFVGVKNPNKKKRGKFQKHKSKKKKLKKKRVDKYSDYLKSNKWLAVRINHFRRFGAICVVCGCTNNIQVHHLLYRGHGREKPTDLVSICKNHHKEFHSEFGRGNQNYTNSFSAFCERERPKYGLED